MENPCGGLTAATPMENPYGEPLWRPHSCNPCGEPLLQLYANTCPARIGQARKEQDMGNSVFHSAMDALKASAASYGAFEAAPADRAAREEAVVDHQAALSAVNAAMNCREIKSPRVKTATGELV